MSWKEAQNEAQAIFDELKGKYNPSFFAMVMRALARLGRKHKTKGHEYKIVFPETITPEWLNDGVRVNAKFRRQLAPRLGITEASLRARRKFSEGEQKIIREYLLELVT